MKKAFTLIETLAVIILIGIVGIIAYPTVSNLISESKSRSYDKQISIILESAKIWSSDNSELYDEQHPHIIDIKDLLKEGYLKSDDNILYNPNTGEELEGCVYIKYSTNYNQYMYNFYHNCVIPSAPTFTNNGIFNEFGWAKEDFYVTITGTDYTGYMYCIGTSECEPLTEVSQSSGNALITIESATNYVCAKGLNQGIEGEINCSEPFKLDKTIDEIGNVEITGTLGNNNWYTSDVSISSINGADNLSGHNTTTIDKNSININGVNTVTVTTIDRAGNSATREVIVKVDKEQPNLTGLSEINIAYGQSYNLVLTGTDNYSGHLSTISDITNTSTLSVGTHIITYTVTDNAGNHKDFTRTINVASEAPDITFNIPASTTNENGWAKSNFYVTMTGSAKSGTSVSKITWCSTTDTTCTPTTVVDVASGNIASALINSNSETNKVCAIVTDSSNHNSDKICSGNYKLDKEIPTAGTADFTGTMGSNSWYTSNVTVNIYNGSDTLSGHNTTTSNIASITDNTVGTTVTITTTDLAGNTNSRDYVIKVDKNSPTITRKSEDTPIIVYNTNYDTSNYFNVSYSISGGTLNCNPINTSSLEVGNQIVTCTATGNNGLTDTNTKTINVKYEDVESGIQMACTDTNGRCERYMVTSNGSAYVYNFYQNGNYIALGINPGYDFYDKSFITSTTQTGWLELINISNVKTIKIACSNKYDRCERYLITNDGYIYAYNNYQGGSYSALGPIAGYTFYDKTLTTNTMENGWLKLNNISNVKDIEIACSNTYSRCERYIITNDGYIYAYNNYQDGSYSALGPIAGYTFYDKSFTTNTMENGWLKLNNISNVKSIKMACTDTNGRCERYIITNDGYIYAYNNYQNGNYIVLGINPGYSFYDKSFITSTTQTGWLKLNNILNVRNMKIACSNKYDRCERYIITNDGYIYAYNNYQDGSYSALGPIAGYTFYDKSLTTNTMENGWLKLNNISNAKSINMACSNNYNRCERYLTISDGNMYAYNQYNGSYVAQGADSGYSFSNSELTTITTQTGWLKLNNITNVK